MEGEAICEWLWRMVLGLEKALHEWGSDRRPQPIAPPQPTQQLVDGLLPERLQAGGCSRVFGHETEGCELCSGALIVPDPILLVCRGR